jgi:hypothetical protein
MFIHFIFFYQLAEWNSKPHDSLFRILTTGLQNYFHISMEDSISVPFKLYVPNKRQRTTN